MSVDPIRAEFEAWFTATYGPDPTPGELLANLTEAARLQAFTAGAWAAWKHCRAVQVVVVGNDEPTESDPFHGGSPYSAEAPP